jgi:NAD(P)-dependent dehydrogenase (short-subunit alcohol dehydrogenase family)
MQPERENLLKIVETLLAEIDAIVDRKVEEKLPEMVRALGLREAEAETEKLSDALDVAKLLGCDVSSPEKVRAAKKRVYNLAGKDLIPSVRISPRCVKFDLAKVRKVIASGGKAEPYSRAA